MKIGILRETKTPPDNRVPLSPKQCRQLEDLYTGLQVLVQPSTFRCFQDEDYEREKIRLNEDLSACDILMGVKEVNPQYLMQDKTYLFFSHTIKKQRHNKALLKAILEKHIRMIDYEILTDKNGLRIIGFGRWAGLVGTYNGLRAMCIRYHLPGLLPTQECPRLKDMLDQASACKLSPLRIAITGDGRVAGGSEEMLRAFGVHKVDVEEYLNIRQPAKPVYVQLGPDKYHRNIMGNPFDLHHFFSFPHVYESSFDRFIERTDLLVMAAYWDPRAPVLFTQDQMNTPGFSIRVIADISCDLNGSVPSTIRTTTFSDPFYDYNPKTGKEEAAFCHPDNITVMTIDNLPCGLPVEASIDFGEKLLNFVLPLIMNGDPDKIIAGATIAEKGQLTEKYKYLEEWLNGQ
jgi:saccharopine dehydrogenase (NAD+, L-lysine-forming)